ncbi:MAG: ECF transporter S component [Coriobacteriia bacterium]|nr:ECF transporter S component [Coriobacteriia bacterium]
MSAGKATGVLQRLEVPALVLVPATLLGCAYLQIDQAALLTMLVALLCLMVFFAGYERSRPPLKQIMPTVVLAALAAAGRMIFAPIPDFKPVSAIAIIAGVVFGKRCGFMVGALAALVSNFFFGQGPWTPWQMYAWGLMGYMAGVLASHGAFKRPAVLYAYGFLAPFLGYGLILNSWYVVGFVHPLTWPAVVAAFAAAAALDLTHGVATVVFLLALYEPWKRKLQRIKNKYDLMLG